MNSSNTTNSSNKEEKKMADAMRIFEALSGVDEELLARSEESVEVASFRKVRPFWYYGRVLAACLCLMVSGVVLFNVGSIVLQDKESSSDCAANMEIMLEEAAIDSNAGETGNAEAAVAESGYGVPAEEAEEAVTTEGSQSELPETEGALAAAGSDNTNSSLSQSQQNSGVTSSELESNKQQDLKNQISNAETDIASAEESLADSREKLTLQEAKADAVLGEYVPETIPSGYTFESASKKENASTGETECITLCWVKGMDSIHLSISKVDSEQTATVDISKPETYDVHLYEIPYAETVPEEYRVSFNNPMFAEKDFSLDIVRARMKVVSDQGDTDTPRGNFAVLNESGVCVEFSGRGDAESIYEMFESIK